MLAIEYVYCMIFILLITVESITSTELSYTTCGSVIKLVNQKYQARLHSHEIKYGSGSGQQSVTGMVNQADTNSLWAVKGKSDEPCKRGEPIKCGSIIRLEHLTTHKNLHSHLFKSPISDKQEVSAFGDKGEGDTGDNWTLVCNDEVWQRQSQVRLKHVDTEMWLSLSGRTYNHQIAGQFEVVATQYPDASSYWQTAEGVFVKPPENREFNTEHDEL